MSKNTKAKNHTHKYFRLPADGLWHCGHPACTHYMPSNMPVPVWKMSRCWSCGRIIQLTPDSMKFMYPTCDTCEAYVPEVVDTEHDEDFTDGIERIMRENRLKRIKEEAEKQRAQSTNPVEEDKPESEYIPPKYDVE